jgi:hypothetical protein
MDECKLVFLFQLAGWEKYRSWVAALCLQRSSEPDLPAGDRAGSADTGGNIGRERDEIGKEFAGSLRKWQS